MKKRDPVNFIYFAVQQAKQAEKFGFKRNECCRNLKLAIDHYWRKVHLKQRKKENMPRSIVAQNEDLKNCDVEHSVPLMVLVNKLMDRKRLTKNYISKTLTSCYRVMVITRGEHRLLNSTGLTSRMPENWDGKDVWARYSAVKIKLPKEK